MTLHVPHVDHFAKLYSSAYISAQTTTIYCSPVTCFATEPNQLFNQNRFQDADCPDAQRCRQARQRSAPSSTCSPSALPVGEETVAAGQPAMCASNALATHVLASHMLQAFKDAAAVTSTCISMCTSTPVSGPQLLSESQDLFIGADPDCPCSSSACPHSQASGC
jgi:hypothetical protein